jgi:dihydrofolate reductase
MNAIAAMSLNRVIGCGGKVPWHLPEEMKWFKRMTAGNVVLMGRKTFESIGKPLPDRVNVVVTRNRTGLAGVEIVPSPDAFDPAIYNTEVFVIGGAEIYKQTLSQSTDLFLTVVRREVAGDAFFPDFEDDFAFVAVVLHYPDFEVRHYRNRRMLIA